MTGQDARDVIAEAINDDGWTCDVHEPHRFGECTPCRDAQTHTAQAALDALTDAGYAIVRLPERDMTSEHATPESQHEVPLWALGDGLVAVVSTCCGELSVTGGDYQPDEGRTLAAAILAAAAHAEAGEGRG